MSANRKVLRAFMHLGALDEVISAPRLASKHRAEQAFKRSLQPYAASFGTRIPTSRWMSPSGSPIPRWPGRSCTARCSSPTERELGAAVAELGAPAPYLLLSRSSSRVGRTRRVDDHDQRSLDYRIRIWILNLDGKRRSQMDEERDGPPLLSQLAHVELTTPTPEESLEFWTDVVGLEETARVGQSAYLRAWGDRFHHTLQLTEGPETGLGHIGWRAASPEALGDAVARLEAAGVGEGWFEDSVGHGRAFRYRGPGGHLHEVFWDVERYVPPPGMESPFPNRPQRYVPRGAAVRCIDHVTVTTGEPDRRRRVVPRHARSALHGVHDDPRPPRLSRSSA